MQHKLDGNRLERASGRHAAQPSLLAGLIYEESGERMTPSHASKRGMRYRYYISQSLLAGSREQAPHARRVPAEDLERIVVAELRRFLMDRSKVFAAVQSVSDDAHLAARTTDRASHLASTLLSRPAHELRLLLWTLIERIDLRASALVLQIQPAGLPALIAGQSGAPDAASTCHPGDIPAIAIEVPVQLKRAGIETRLLIEGSDGEARAEPDRTLHACWSRRIASRRW